MTGRWERKSGQAVYKGGVRNTRRVRETEEETENMRARLLGRGCKIRTGD